jgi:hypothetical protein
LKSSWTSLKKASLVWLAMNSGSRLALSQERASCSSSWGSQFGDRFFLLLVLEVEVEVEVVVEVEVMVLLGSCS